MISEDDIELFYKDLASLRLKHPLASLVKATGYSRGTVSVYINKVKPPSENFLIAFYKEFEKRLKNVPHEQVNSASEDHLPELTLSDIRTILEELAYAVKKIENRTNPAHPEVADMRGIEKLKRVVHKDTAQKMDTPGKQK